jgi:hypothetical protein
MMRRTLGTFIQFLFPPLLRPAKKLLSETLNEAFRMRIGLLTHPGRRDFRRGPSAKIGRYSTQLFAIACREILVSYRKSRNMIGMKETIPVPVVVLYGGNAPYQVTEVVFRLP